MMSMSHTSINWHQLSLGNKSVSPLYMAPLFPASMALGIGKLQRTKGLFSSIALLSMPKNPLVLLYSMTKWCITSKMCSVSWCSFCLKVRFPKYYRNPVIYPKSSGSRQTRFSWKGLFEDGLTSAHFYSCFLPHLKSEAAEMCISSCSSTRAEPDFFPVPATASWQKYCLWHTAMANKPGKHDLWLWPTPLVPDLPPQLGIIAVAGI